MNTLELSTSTTHLAMSPPSGLSPIQSWEGAYPVPSSFQEHQGTPAPATFHEQGCAGFEGDLSEGVTAMSDRDRKYSIIREMLDGLYRPATPSLADLLESAFERRQMI